MTKRILLISRCPPYPLYLGDRLILYHLAYEFSFRDDYEFDLLAFASRLEDEQEQRYYDAYFESVRLVPEPRRSQFSYLQRALLPGARWPKRAEQSWSPEMWRAIERQLAANHYDLAHLFGGVQVYEFRHALGNIPTLITPYESYSLYLRRQLEVLMPESERGHGKTESKTSFLPPLYEVERGLGGEDVMTKSSLTQQLRVRAQLTLARQFERFMFEPYRRTVVVSERDRDELLALNPALRLEVIPNGVDEYHFRPRPTRRIPALLFVGNYDYAPNVDAALRLAMDILPQVQARIPGVKLWLVGNAPPPEILVLQSQGLKPLVRVTGRVPDVRPYLARAAAFVCPLRLGAGIKNKVLEALAMGCPVVATPLSVDGIHVRDGHEALIAEGSALVDAIVRLLKDEDLQRQLSANGRQLIEAQYSWSRVAGIYERLYREVSDGN